MPKIKVDHVLSFSSEDPNFPASNLLNTDPAKKWKCKKQGEKQAFVILQLEKASLISSIDIGNEHSAYVEVLVARSDGSKESDYKVLLLMSSFMSPLESRQSTNLNKVRMFTTDQLSSPERDEKWDRVKIVCTQPFNRHVQYGLSFITLHSPEDKTAHTPVQQTIGRFVLRPPSPDNIAVGSTFLKRKETPESTSVSAAAAIRDAAASSSSFKPKLFNPNKNQQTPESATKIARNRDDLLYNKDEEEPNEKIDKVMEEKRKENALKKQEEETNKKEKKKERHKKRRSENENNNTPSKKAKQKVCKPFNELLKGVVIVISGIQNPDRADLRTKALSMGAKYKPDWDDNTCTHLICAFANTPKFNQVKGKGKIVTRKWIEDCHLQRKRLPWRKYALDKADKGKPESEDEICEEVATESFNIEDDDIEETNSVKHDGSDTEEEIARIQAQQQKKQTNSDENVLEETDIALLANFFEDKTFHLDTVLNYKDRELLTRYIIAYSGKLTKEPRDADVVITTEDNADFVRTVCGEEALCLKPDWVWECHNQQKCVDFDDFKL